jgi:hypothetical protein
MATPMPAIPVEEDLVPLPLHEEEDVPEGSLHHRWSHYLYNVLRALFPSLFASGNVCIFWDPGDLLKFVAPDVFLVQGPVPKPLPRSYRAWRLPPVIFAVEIGSLATAGRGAKLDRYQEHLQPREVLYTEPIDEEKGEQLTVEQVHLYQWSGTAYEEVAHVENGRVWSEVLQAWIGVDPESNVRVYDREGDPILDYEELEEAYAELADVYAQAQVALRAAEERARAAEERAGEEAVQRAAVEERARVAEERAAEEAAQRAAAEERAREAERRLAELQAQREPDHP